MMKNGWRTHIDVLTDRYVGFPVTRLTPNYLFDRSRVWAYQRRHPDAPWLTAEAISILDTALRKSDNGIEWGSGRSTVWFAQRTNSLLSIEMYQDWYERVNAMLSERGLKNVVYKYIPAVQGYYIPAIQEVSDDPYHMQYIEAEAGLAAESFDYALVDGLYRDECALRAVELLKPGGILVLDNANRFIPHSKRLPFAEAPVPHAPHTPVAVTAAATGLWAEFLMRVATWRQIWTSNGVWNTTLWFKDV